jgi:hypothetical protein
LTAQRIQATIVKTDRKQKKESYSSSSLSINKKIIQFTQYISDVHLKPHLHSLVAFSLREKPLPIRGSSTKHLVGLV